MDHRIDLNRLDFFSAEWAEALVSTAVHAARAAAEIQLDHFRSQRTAHTHLLHDIKLETDRLCEDAITAVIRERYPDHAILTEESGWSPGVGDVIWIIDPLDGTVNFWHGLPFFCVSIACYRVKPALAGNDAKRPSFSADDLNHPIAGVVLLPYSDELFVGIAGRGAFLNGRGIELKPPAHRDNSLVTINFGKTPAMMTRMTGKLRELLPMVGKMRSLGAVAAELCYSACGYLDGIFYEGLKPWDFAAGAVILKEAGGFSEACEVSPESWRVYAGAPVMRPCFEALTKE